MPRTCQRKNLHSTHPGVYTHDFPTILGMKKATPQGGVAVCFWSQQRESNPQPTVYKTVALPLSHAGVGHIMPQVGRPGAQRPKIALSLARVSGERRSSTVIRAWVRSPSSRATSRSVASISWTSSVLEILVTEAA